MDTRVLQDVSLSKVGDTRAQDCLSIEADVKTSGLNTDWYPSGRVMLPAREAKEERLLGRFR